MQPKLSSNIFRQHAFYLVNQSKIHATAKKLCLHTARKYLNMNMVAIYYCYVCTGCGSHFENPTNLKILKEPLLVLKQMKPQQKALDFSFNLAP